MWLTTDETWQIKRRAMIDALKKTLWIVTSACLQVGISRETHYQWLEKYPEYAKEVASVADLALDFAESSLHKQIQDHDTTATIFYLKCRGKKRGYIEKTEVEHSGRMEVVEIFI